MVESGQYAVPWDLILGFADALAWPAVAILIVLIFRRQLLSVVAGLKEAQLPGGVSLRFSRNVEQAKELALDLKPFMPPDGRDVRDLLPPSAVNQALLKLGLVPSHSSLDMRYYREMATRDSVYALSLLRSEIETMTTNLARGYGISTASGETPESLVGKLEAMGAITGDQANLTRRLLHICSRAVHSDSVSAANALETIEVADVLANQFLRWLTWRVAA